MLTFMWNLLPLLNFDSIKLKLKLATGGAYLKLGEAEQLHHLNLLLYSQLQRAFDFVEVWLHRTKAIILIMTRLTEKENFNKKKISFLFN